MKIAIVGSRGFVGSNILRRFTAAGHQTLGLTRDVLDLLDPTAVRNWLTDNRPDVVVNCAAVMTDATTLHDTRNNLGMFMNFYNNAHLFGKFINTGSGAEFDRRRAMDSIDESELFRSMPADSYGFGQNIKARLCSGRENFYTLRIFNCFGPGEQYTRLLPRFIEAKGDFRIVNDRYFDYFGIDDLYTVIKHYSVVKNIPAVLKDINCVYKDKILISDFVGAYCDIHNIPRQYYSIDSVSALNYTGSGEKLQALGLDLIGLQASLEKYK
jgi:nucleoside-diphosphate-sugar epimerase